MAKAKKSKKTARKRRKAGASSTGVAAELRALRQQVEDLATTAYELHQVRRAYRTLPAAATRAAGAAVKQVSMKFTKQPGSPSFVRITLVDNQEEVLSPGRDEGTAAPRDVGSEVDAFIEVKGNPGQVATVQVQNALPKMIRMSALPGETGNQGTKPMLVVG
jgi:hypothetical protein